MIIGVMCVGRGSDGGWEFNCVDDRDCHQSRLSVAEDWKTYKWTGERFHLDKAATRMVMDELTLYVAGNAAASYKAAGEHGAWDGDALAAMEMMVAPPKDLKWQALREKQIELLNKAMAAGCRDPLVRYYHRSTVGEPEDVTPAEQAHRFQALVKTMMESKYPAFWKLIVVDGYATYLKDRWGDNVDVRDPMKVVPGAIDAALPLWKESLKDDGVPDDVLFGIAERLVEEHQEWAWLTTDRGEYFSRYFEPWVATRPSSSAAYALRCHVYCDYSRDKHLEDNRKVKVKIFGPEDPTERLAAARAAGEKAWELNPCDTLASSEMIRVCLLESSTRDEMDRWYTRASSINPRSLAPCFEKAWWLVLKGPAESGLQFARECVRTADTDSERLFVLLRIHHELFQVAEFNNPHDMYYQGEDVFADMQLTYEKLLSIEPDNREFRSRYAFYAMKAKQWDIAKKQFDLLGDHPDVTPFGSMTVYKYERRRANRMLDEEKSGGK